MGPFRFSALAALVCATALAACASPATEAAAALDKARAGQAAASGAARSSTEESVPQSGLAASHMGDATQTQLHAKAQRQVNSTASGPVQLGFQQGEGNKEQLEVFASLAKSDPIVLQVTAQITALMPVYVAAPDNAAIAGQLKELRGELAARLESLQKESRAIAGNLDLSRLTTLVVLNSIAGYTTGAEPKALTEAETKAMEGSFVELWKQLGPVLAK